MNIVYKAPCELKPYDKNAKKHDELQVANVAESIRQYGFVQPIVIDRNNVVVVGHCRLLASKKLQLRSVPCVCVDELTEEQVRALRIVDNKTNESPWDFGFLADDLVDLSLDGFSFDFNFDMDSGEDYSPDEFGDEFSLATGDKPEICQMTFTLHQRQKELIEYAISVSKEYIEETFGNTNANGNALYEVVRQWVEQRK
jgi:hypothetical protein